MSMSLMTADNYPVYPEQEGEWDRPVNPYSPVINTLP